MPIGAFKLNTIARYLVPAGSSGRTAVTITPNGSAENSPGFAQFGGSSYKGNGSDSYLTASSLSIGTGDFTFECWVRHTDSSVVAHQLWETPGGTTAFDLLGVSGSQYLSWYTGSSWYNAGQTTGIAANNWYHVAVTRTSGTIDLWINGTKYGSGVTDTRSFTGTFAIAASAGGSYPLKGNMDEVRISNTARYTGSSFTVSTKPFVNDTNTLLLLHMNGSNHVSSFIDDIGTNYTDRRYLQSSAYGNAKISTTQYKFGTSSALFDGNGDYLVLEDSSDLTDLTVELWYRPNTMPGSGLVPLISFNNTLMYIGYSGGTVYDFYNGGSRIALNPVTINTGTWYHVAFVRSGNNITVYHNGTSVATGTWGTAVNWSAAGPEIAKYSSYYFDGNMDELRISDTARYTGNFTPSTTPFVEDSHTVLLMHMEGVNNSTMFIDGPSILEAGGQTAISTSYKKFGYSSLVFDGSGDYLKATKGDWGNSSDFTGDFTIEAFLRFVALPSTGSGGYFMLYSPGPGGAATPYISMTNTSIQVALPGDKYGDWAMSTPSTNTWYHLAVVRSSGTYKVYWDGTEKTSFTNTYNWTPSGSDLMITNPHVWGQFIDSRGSFNGYMDEIRISKTARYTGNFTPTTSAFIRDADTLLLIHADSISNSVFVEGN